MNLEPSPQPLPLPPPPLAPEPSSAPERPAGEGVRALLSAVRQRQRQRLWWEGALYGTALALLFLWAGGLLGERFSSSARALWILAPVAGTGVAVFFGVFRALGIVGDEARTARFVAQRQAPQTLDLLAAVELARLPVGTESGHSPFLVEAFLAQMDRRCEALDPRLLVEARPVRRAGGVLAGLVGLLALSSLFWVGPWLRGASQVLAAPSRVAEAPRAEPITGDIELSFRYPAYTGLASKTLSGTNGEVRAPVGTELRLKTRSDREVARAQLQVNGKTLPLTVTEGRALAGSFVVSQSGHYQFLFFGPSGELLATGPEIPIVADPDQAPQVALLTPAEEVEVHASDRLTLKYEASDDYGLTELALVYSPPEAAEPIRIPLRKEEGRRSRGVYTWDLAPLKAAAGDRIRYHVEARDNDAAEGPKPGVSRTQVLKIYDAAEHRRAALEKAEALWERMVLHLGDRLESEDRKPQPSLEALRRGASTDANGQALTTELRGLGQALAQDRDAPAELTQALLNIADGLSQRLRATSELRRLALRSVQQKPAPGKSQQLAASVEQEVAEWEKDVLYLESLLDRQKLQELKELAQRLSQERRALSQLIEQYKASPSEAGKEEVLRQIDALKGRIQELTRRMNELRQGIRDEHLNAEALNEMMKDQDLQSALDQVESLMREGKSDEALAKLQELSTQLEQMMQGLDQAEGDFGNEQFPELAKKFNQFMGELEQTAAEQERIAQRTRALRDKARAQNRERQAQNAQALKEELKRAAAKLLNDYKEVGADALNSRAARPMEEAQAELSSVGQALDVDDFDLAAEAAARASRAAEQLAMLGEQQRQLDEMFGNPEEVRQQSSSMAERLSQNGREMRALQKKLESLFPPPGSQLSEAEQKALQSLAEQQQQMSQRAQGLRQQMEEMEQMAPLFGEEAAQQMDQVGERMGDAAQRMQGKDARRGYGEQQAALEGLRQFQQRMKESQRGQGKGQGGLPLPMGAGRRQGMSRDSQEKVELPDEDAFQAPKEFRKDLLDAMKQGAPERYRDQVKRYYEELVK